LLAVWEEGTSSSVINDVLARLEIRTADHGKLDVAASVGFANAAKEVSARDGIAIAAHIDKPKGLLGLEVKAQLRRTLMEECLAAVEITKSASQQAVENRLGGERLMAYVRGSDTWDPGISAHSLAGIGSRRTWIKASRPDLVGIRHAMKDPDLRISLTQPEISSYVQIERVEVTGGFLDGQAISLCPDLNCLLGGTGAGKSLVLEAIRFALEQQIDHVAFRAIYEEVASRLEEALG
jgi:hypothetical protein